MSAGEAETLSYWAARVDALEQALAAEREAREALEARVAELEDDSPALARGRERRRYNLTRSCSSVGA
jgi:cell division protein FtsB